MYTKISLVLVYTIVVKMGRKVKNKKSEARGSASTRSDDDVMIHDPGWLDIEELPPLDDFRMFTPPPKNHNTMLAAREDWACGAPANVTNALANTVSNFVYPRLEDMCSWRRHATDFFQRLCAHRRAMHTQYEAAIKELQTKHDALKAELACLRADLVALKASHASVTGAVAASQGGRGASASVQCHKGC